MEPDSPPPPEDAPETPPTEPAPPPAAVLPAESPVELPLEPEPEGGAPPAEKPRKEPKKPKKRPSYEMKLFGKYDMTDVAVRDAGLAKAAPREEITRLRFGGISVPRAVDVAPSRRLDLALRNICVGAVTATFKNRKPVEECLADEILTAAKGDMQSSAIAKKEELERIAASAR